MTKGVIYGSYRLRTKDQIVADDFRMCVDMYRQAVGEQGLAERNLHKLVAAHGSSNLPADVAADLNLLKGGYKV